MDASWVLGLWNAIVSLGFVISLIFCLTNEDYPLWQRLIGAVVILLIGAFLIVDF